SSSSSSLQIWKLLSSIILLIFINYIDCQSITSSSSSSSLPYRHGLARYYHHHPSRSPLSSPRSSSNIIHNSYPLSSTFTSYSITLPVHQQQQQQSLNIERQYGPYQQSYYQPPPSPPNYQPQPQYCPETGRTVCSKVPYYPSDEVFLLIKMAKAKRFNISSEFIDESENDSEPYFDDDFGEQYGDIYTKYPYSEPYNNYHNQQTQPQHPPLSPGHQYQQQQRQQQPYRYRMNSIIINHEQPQHPSIVQHYHNLDWKYIRNIIPSSNHQRYSMINNNHNNNNNNNPINGGDGTIQSINSNSGTIDTNNNNHNSIKSMYSHNGDHNHHQSFSNNHYNNHQNPNGGNQNHNGHNGGHSRYKRQADETSISIEPLCPSRTILLEPKAALNDRRQWKYVVNIADRDRRLRQAIKVEVCMTPNSPCSNQISLSFGFVSRCRQKYIKKKLLSLDESGQSISSENFFAPSCCVCEVTRDGNSPISPANIPTSSSSNLDTASIATAAASAAAAAGSTISETTTTKKRINDSKRKPLLSMEKFDIDRLQSDAPSLPSTTKTINQNDNRKTRNNNIDQRKGIKI
uniref:Transcription factor mef2A-like n=1 Tax=Dermatophagoides pteronyssinus TaxID=6956 RepID=A0A6P6YCX3_DERPT